MAVPSGVGPFVQDAPQVYWKALGPIKAEDYPNAPGRVYYVKEGHTRTLGAYNRVLNSPYWSPNRQFVFVNNDHPFRGSGVICYPESGWIYEVNPTYQHCFWQPGGRDKDLVRMVCLQTYEGNTTKGRFLQYHERPFGLLTITRSGTAQPTVTESAISRSDVDKLFGPSYRAAVEPSQLQYLGEGFLVLSEDGQGALVQNIQLDSAGGPGGNDFAPVTRMLYLMVRGKKLSQHIAVVRREIGRRNPYINFIGWTSGSRWLIGQHAAVDNEPPSGGGPPGAVVAVDPATWKETVLFKPPALFDLVAFREEIKADTIFHGLLGS